MSNYAVTLPHLMIGIFNGIDNYLLHIIDSIIITVSEGEQILWGWYKHIDTEIASLKNDVNEWMNLPAGRIRAGLD